MHPVANHTLLCFALLVAAPTAAGAEIEPAPLLLDRVVGVVGDRLVLASDVALERALAWRDPRPFPLGERADRQALDVLIDAAVVRGLAGDVAVYQPSTADVRERLAVLRDTWEDPGEYIRFLSAFGLDEERLSGVLYARIVVERYVQRAVVLPSQAAGESEEQLRARYDAWIEEARDQVQIRLTRVWSSEPEAFPLDGLDGPEAPEREAP